LRQPLRKLTEEELQPFITGKETPVGGLHNRQGSELERLLPLSLSQRIIPTRKNELALRRTQGR
jgi:hypothetical protein